MKTRREKLLAVLLIVLCIYAITLKDSISSAITTYFMPSDTITVSMVVVHRGGYTGGPYAGWNADDSGHWVDCRCGCGRAMQGIGSTAYGSAAHWGDGSTCEACGYPMPTNKTSQSTQSNKTSQSSQSNKTSQSEQEATIHKGVRSGGPYVGWYADNSGHWVLCSCGCGRAMQGIGSYQIGKVPHSWNSKNSCEACGYKNPNTTSVQGNTNTNNNTNTTHTHKISYGPNNGWFADENYHWIQCTGCSEKLMYADEQGYDRTLVVGQRAHTFNKNTGKCPYCAYTNKNANVTGSTSKTHIGVRSGGPYVGWYADDSGHWVLCSCGCGQKMKGIGSSEIGIVSHNWNNQNSCEQCGYKKPNATSSQGNTNTNINTNNNTNTTHTHKISYGPNNGWFADENYHWIQCTGCSEKLMYADEQGYDRTLVVGQRAHTFNKNTGKCPYCAYTNKNANVTGNTSKTHIGARSGGPYAGWYADESGHWVLCSCGCGQKMKGIGSSEIGIVSHNWNNKNSCEACGYKKPNATSSQGNTNTNTSQTNNVNKAKVTKEISVFWGSKAYSYGVEESTVKTGEIVSYSADPTYSCVVFGENGGKITTKFKGWEVSGVTSEILSNGMTITFTMPNNDVQVKAIYGDKIECKKHVQGNVVRFDSENHWYRCNACQETYSVKHKWDSKKIKCTECSYKKMKLTSGAYGEGGSWNTSNSEEYRNPGEKITITASATFTHRPSGGDRNDKVTENFTAFEVSGATPEYSNNGMTITFTMPENDVTVKKIYGSKKSCGDLHQAGEVVKKDTKNHYYKCKKCGEIYSMPHSWNLSKTKCTIVACSYEKVKLTSGYYGEGGSWNTSQNTEYKLPGEQVSITASVTFTHRPSGGDRNDQITEKFKAFEVSGATPQYSNNGMTVTFTMPENDVTVKVIYGEKKACGNLHVAGKVVKKDTKNHYYECKRCGETYAVVHAWNIGKTKCSVCDYEKPKASKECSHVNSTWVTNDKYHWRKCSNSSCGYIFEETRDQHSSSDKWYSNYYSHFKKCECGYATEKGNHSFVTQYISKAKISTCTQCGYTKYD